MPASCSAFNCKRRKIKGGPNISFHKFPLKRPELNSKWLAAMRRPNWRPSVYSSLCERHFKGSDFTSPYDDEVRRLRYNAVPSLFNFPGRMMKTREGVKLVKVKSSQPIKLKITVKENCDTSAIPNENVKLPNIVTIKAVPKDNLALGPGNIAPIKTPRLNDMKVVQTRECGNSRLSPEDVANCEPPTQNNAATPKTPRLSNLKIVPTRDDNSTSSSEDMADCESPTQNNPERKPLEKCAILASAKLDHVYTKSIDCSYDEVIRSKEGTSNKDLLLRKPLEKHDILASAKLDHVYTKSIDCFYNKIIWSKEETSNKDLLLKKLLTIVRDHLALSPEDVANYESPTPNNTATVPTRELNNSTSSPEDVADCEPPTQNNAATPKTPRLSNLKIVPTRDDNSTSSSEDMADCESPTQNSPERKPKEKCAILASVKLDHTYIKSIDSLALVKLDHAYTKSTECPYRRLIRLKKKVSNTDLLIRKVSRRNSNLLKVFRSLAKKVERGNLPSKFYSSMDVDSVF